VKAIWNARSVVEIQKPRKSTREGFTFGVDVAVFAAVYKFIVLLEAVIVHLR